MQSKAPTATQPHHDQTQVVDGYDVLDGMEHAPEEEKLAVLQAN